MVCCNCREYFLFERSENFPDSLGIWKSRFWSCSAVSKFELCRYVDEFVEILVEIEFELFLDPDEVSPSIAKLVRQNRILTPYSARVKACKCMHDVLKGEKRRHRGSGLIKPYTVEDIFSFAH